MEENPPLFQPATLVIAGLIAVAAIIGGYYWYTLRSEPVRGSRPAPEAPATPAPPATAPAPSSAAPLHPIDDHASDHNLTLDNSDAPFLEALSQLSGWRASTMRLLIPSGIIRHIVSTVDGLPRQKLALQALPTRPVPGNFRVATAGEAQVIGPANDHRYDLYVQAFTAIDAAQAAGLYRRFYPQFEQAYRELGYPGGYFNDRLVEVIDDLLDAPVPKPPVAVIAPRAMYRYVDPDLEALSVGQKMLVRSGPANERAIKAKLSEFRQAITAP